MYVFREVHLYNYMFKGVKGQQIKSTAATRLWQEPIAARWSRHFYMNEQLARTSLVLWKKNLVTTKLYRAFGALTEVKSLKKDSKKTFQKNFPIQKIFMLDR